MKELKRFGFNLGLGLNILGCIMFYRGRGHFIWFTGMGSLSLIFAIMRPGILRPLKKILDLIILLIGRFVNLVTLAFSFYLIFTPMAILLKLFGRDLLHKGIDKNADSYWIKRRGGIFTKNFYERMG